MISFVNDYSHKVWFYFLVNKSEAFITFKKYKNRVEKETGSSIKYLRPDHGSLIFAVRMIFEDN